MHAFETYLVNKGYIKHLVNKWKFEKTNKHIISTMVNLSHSYIHESDPLLDKIAKGASIKDLTLEDRKGEIVFGLNERATGVTLISPRPIIVGATKLENDSYVYQATSDHLMDRVLSGVPFDEIYKAMFDKSIVFRFDIPLDELRKQL